MRQSRALIFVLAGLCLIGIQTLRVMGISEMTPTARLTWSLFLILTPLALSGVVHKGWSWTGMACVIYGTVGLALDLATVAGVSGGTGGTDGLLLWSLLSGLFNLLLIVGGGRAFVQSLLGQPPPGSHPPSPPSPSSSSAA